MSVTTVGVQDRGVRAAEESAVDRRDVEFPVCRPELVCRVAADRVSVADDGLAWASELSFSLTSVIDEYCCAQDSYAEHMRPADARRSADVQVQLHTLRLTSLRDDG